MTDRGLGRRDVLKGAAALGAGLLFPSTVTARPKRRRGPGSLPRPHLPAGTDVLPQIEHIIVVMMENHSFDNYFGLRLDRRGSPLDTNPDGQGHRIRAFHMPSTCQFDSEPNQSWNASHTSLGPHRTNDGFVLASGPVAMGYWNENDLPFYYGLARTFVLCDRWFASCPAQTYPNRRFLLCGSALGTVSTDIDEILAGHAPVPPNGTIFELLNAHGVSWRDYATDLAQAYLFPPVALANKDKLKTIAQFYLDAAAGTLPAVSFVDPAFVPPADQDEENPADVRVGQAFVAQVVNAVLRSPAWPRTVLVWMYDEHGGYYDHVPPPRAIPPDDIPPRITVPPDQPGGYDRYGFRVPAVVVSPYARRHHVSHRVHDHT